VCVREGGKMNDVGYRRIYAVVCGGFLASFLFVRRERETNLDGMIHDKQCG